MNSPHPTSPAEPETNPPANTESKQGGATPASYLLPPMCPYCGAAMRPDLPVGYKAFELGKERLQFLQDHPGLTAHKCVVCSGAPVAAQDQVNRCPKCESPHHLRVAEAGCFGWATVIALFLGVVYTLRFGLEAPAWLTLSGGGVAALTFWIFHAKWFGHNQCTVCFHEWQ